ncbi:AbrB/MazE/SpoVT family DNA-binding domain-containing protein [Romboutsia sp. MSSM.1001216sp_RTP31141st1_G3_RTP31141_220114]|uniref:AbrB/MazE/SpoVT family DNA-binding domain-containing protein n=1 Tax=unclassified Romboutsia TaxID=2626894 RepID=UPI0031B62EAB
MEKRNLNVSFNKSGRGSLTTRVTLPIAWIKEMGIDEENRKIEVVFENNEIRIKKLDK